MVHEYEIEGVRLQTGDIICTTDGGAGVLGAFWFLIGKIIPGEVDPLPKPPCSFRRSR